MAVLNPNTLTVECNGCGKTQQMDTVEYVGDELPTFGVSIDTLADNEWSVAGYDTFCPECSLEEEPEDA